MSRAKEESYSGADIEDDSRAAVCNGQVLPARRSDASCRRHAWPPLQLGNELP